MASARSAEDAEPGRFPQVSGVQFTFDASRKAGERIVEVKVNGLPLDDTKKYTLTTTTFVALDGGDGYTMLKGAKVIIPPEKAPIDVDVIKNAISSRKSYRPENRGTHQTTGHGAEVGAKLQLDFAGKFYGNPRRYISSQTL